MPPKPEEVDDTDFVYFQHFKPFSIRKGKPILPWESYRDWLMLMIHYFNATEVLGGFALKPKIEPDTAISITILTPPLSNRWMIPWTEFLENERLFPALPAVSSGRDLIEFLNKPVNINEVPSNIISFYQELKEGGHFSASGRGFAGAYHCKAYIASLLTSSERDVKDFKEGLDIEGSVRLMRCWKILRQVTFSCIT